MSVKDDDLWDIVAETVKPLKGRERKKTLSTLTVKRVKPVMPSYTPEPQKKSEKPSPPPLRTQRKLNQQKIPVEAKLDLHGYTVAKAHVAVARFIAQARKKNLRCVEIVTGRGDPEKGTGQLRRHVPLWLEEDATILHIQESHLSRGGSILILLRRNKTRS